MSIEHTPAPAENTTGYTLQDPAALVLDDRGMIRNCNKSCEKLFGYRSSELAWQHVSRLFPQLSEVQLVQNGVFNPHLEFLCHFGLPFRARKYLGDTFDSELHFVHLNQNGRFVIRLLINPSHRAKPEISGAGSGKPDPLQSTLNTSWVGTDR